MGHSHMRPPKECIPLHAALDLVVAKLLSIS